MVGNQMKMREVLEKIVELTTPCEGVTSIELQVNAEALTALSEPPRNCDRFKTAEEAWNAYDEWVESFRVNRRMPPYNVFGWLFAPAEELKGDGDGK